MTDTHQRLREAHQAANSFGKDSYVMILNSDLGALLAERDTLATEAQEQARLLGGGAERELRLMAERDALREALEIARDFVVEALAQERAAYRGYESVSSIADIERYLAQIDTAMEKQP